MSSHDEAGSDMRKPCRLCQERSKLQKTLKNYLDGNLRPEYSRHMKQDSLQNPLPA
jgi:hypothetical protein